MQKFKFIYTIQTLLILYLVYALISNKFANNRIIPALIILVFTIIVSLVIKKKNVASHDSKKVTKLMVICAISYLLLYYVLGTITGFLKNIEPLDLRLFARVILPIGTMIICEEIIRYKLLTIKTKLSLILTFIIAIVIDILIYSNSYDLSLLDNFLTFAGYVTISSICMNILYNFISKRYGYRPIIIYRLITILYYYIIPIHPDVYMFFRTIARMFYPVIVYKVLENNLNFKEEMQVKQKRNKQTTGLIVLLIVSIPLVMLISCKFMYGAVVIGSSSMTGTIDKGDVIVYKEIEKNEKVNEGDVVIFNKNGSRVVHRVVQITKVNNVYRYYTQGDANPTMDVWYVVDNEIIGKVKFKIIKIGFPTIWLNEMFDKIKK